MSRFRPSTPAQRSEYGEPVTLAIAIIGAVSALGGGGLALWKSSKDKKTAERQTEAALLLQQQQEEEAARAAERRMTFIKWAAFLGVGGTIAVLTTKYAFSED
jgi:hypothetical protein